MRKFITTTGSVLLVALVSTALTATAQQAAAAPNQNPQTQTAPPLVDEWGDDFNGEQLDETKWEPYTFEGGGGGKIQVKDNELRMRGDGGSRSGVRSKQSFHGDRFYVEAVLVKVGMRTPQPGEEAFPPGFAILTVLFDGSPTNRLEWILRSDGNFEAWQSVDGRMIRVDNGKLATRQKMPKLGIARRGEKIYFMLNREVGLESTIRGCFGKFQDYALRLWFFREQLGFSFGPNSQVDKQVIRRGVSGR